MLGPPPYARILIADDEPLFLKTTGELLRRAGYDCTCVADAHAALDALSRQPFDLVLSDLAMPGNFRLELLHQGRGRWPDVPLIVVTGVPSLPTAVESLRLGIADYLLKPVGYQDLLSSIRRVLRRRRVIEACPEPPARQDTSRDRVVDRAERDYLVSLLARHGGNVSESARQAGMSRQGLHKLLRRHGVRAADFRTRTD